MVLYTCKQTTEPQNEVRLRMVDTIGNNLKQMQVWLLKGTGDNMVAEYNFYGQGEWSVQTPDGDDIIFPTEAEALEFIKEYENEAWHLRNNMI